MPTPPEQLRPPILGVRRGCLLVKYMQNARLRRINGLARGVNLVLAQKKGVILKTTLKDNVNTLRPNWNLTSCG